MMDLRSLVDVFKHFASIYKNNSKGDERDYDLCRKYAALSQRIVFGVLLGYVAVVLVFQGSAYCVGFISGDLKPINSIYFPLLDQMGKFGSILTHLTNIVNMDTSLATLIPFEMITYLVFANIMLSSSVIKREIDDFRVILESPETTEHEIKRKLFQIIRMQHTHNV